MRIRIVTLNAGLLDLFGGRLQLVPFVEERLRALPGRLRSLNADIIALQEVYRQPHREFIHSELKNTHPYSMYGRKRRNLGLENGLLVLSKRPGSGSLTLFRNAPLDEALFDNKGTLLCQVDLAPGNGLALLNVHTTAGGFWIHPEAPKANSIRERQIRTILSIAGEESCPSVIVGDLNAGLGVSEVNLRQVLEAGYESVYDCMHGANGGCTWDPLNSLNRESPHKACPPQRIDHILVRKSDLQTGRLTPIASEICFREEVVPVAGGRKVTVSDHYALQVDLEYQRSSQ